MAGHVAVAASGGRDSTALLHATVQAARALGLRVHALHVHHGLHPDADAWAERVRGQCRRWGATFHLARLPGAPAPAESVEAWAR
ncbi:MAG: tRNA(Ile)-lysidine synthetase, partial [Rhodoferax sp.]|nr:tRNA(Ile)-lysidine synthetase [Rhodoferax sp.]